MPESPLGLVYAVRTFAASVAAKNADDFLMVLPIQCSGMRRGKTPHVVSEIGIESRCKFF